MRTDKEIMADIEEYRTLRTIIDNFRYSRDAHILDILGAKLFQRMIDLNNSTWPARNEKFKAFNDQRL